MLGLSGSTPSDTRYLITSKFPHLAAKSTEVSPSYVILVSYFQRKYFRQNSVKFPQNWSLQNVEPCVVNTVFSHTAYSKRFDLGGWRAHDIYCNLFTLPL